jgi:hypothetical protein
MHQYQTTYLKHFADVYEPAQAALTKIVGTSLSGRQRHAVESLLHALSDEVASAKTRR